MVVTVVKATNWLTFFVLHMHKKCTYLARNSLHGVSETPWIEHQVQCYRMQ